MNNKNKGMGLQKYRKIPIDWTELKTVYEKLTVDQKETSEINIFKTKKQSDSLSDLIDY